MKRRKYISVIFTAFLTIFLYSVALNDGTVEYRSASSENYRLIIDHEQACYRLYDKEGNALGGRIDIGCPLIIGSGDNTAYLYTLQEDGNAYMPVPVDEELKNDIIRAMGKAAYYEEPLTDYDIYYDEGSGLSYILRKGRPKSESFVILKDEEDIRAYSDMAEKYAIYFKEAGMPENVEIGYIFGDLEIKGLAHRFENGFIYTNGNQIAYIDTEDVKNGWSLSLRPNEFLALSDYLENDETPYLSPEYEYWRMIFDMLSIEHDLEIDPESIRYKAAAAYLDEVYGGFPPAEMSDKTAESILNITLKEFNEEGYRENAEGVAGLDATGMDPAEFHIITDVPEIYRDGLYEYETDNFLYYGGLSRNFDEKSRIYKECQLETEVEERLKVSWTLGQYDRAYSKAMLAIIKDHAPAWEYGDYVDPEWFSDMSREAIERCIVSDGVNLTITVSPEIRDILEEERMNVLSKPRTSY